MNTALTVTKAQKFEFSIIPAIVSQSGEDALTRFLFYILCKEIK